MRKKLFHPNLAAVIAALLAFIAMGEINFFVGLIAFVPLFVCLINASSKQSIRLGLIFGVVLSCFAYSWMIIGAERFTGYNFLYGAGVFLISTLFVSIYWSALLFCFSLLKKPSNTLSSTIYNSIIAAVLFCVFEFLLSFVVWGFPWFSFYAGSAFMENLYAIQAASFLGIYILTFIAVVVNYLLAAFIVQKHWKKLFIPIAAILIYLMSGYFIYSNFNSTHTDDKSIKVAVLNENIPPDIKWNDTTGNILVQRLLDLNKQAVRQKPDIILWSESAIPWTYRKDDDLVNEILKESAPSHATQILGINTEVEGNVVNNSAYCILPDGNVAGRYDKQFLLSLIEKPIGSLDIPFFSSKGFFVSKDVAHNEPLQTPYGKAGVMICNETTCAQSATNASRLGAEFLCNMSNDGWFNNTYIVRNHFYTARLRAVEARKDMAINCNNGYSGSISANGNIINQQRDTDPFVTMETIHLNDYKSLSTQYPLLLVYVCAGFIVFVIAEKIFQRLKKHRNN
jgi:apolipoprotein N-acyltransferase